METEKQLLEKAQAGDGEAFKLLLEGALPKISGLLYQQYKISLYDLEDVVQVASIKAWQKLSAFRGDSAFITWFYTITRNEAINFVNKRRRIDSHELSAHILDEEEDYEKILHASLDDKLNETAHSILERQETLKVYREAIEAVLDKLAPAHSQIIKLILEENKSYKEIAELLNIPIGTVMSRLFFAKKNAQKLITQYAKRNELQLDCLGGCK